MAMHDVVNKADGWDYLIKAGFSFNAARFAFQNAPKAYAAVLGSDESGNPFVIPKWTLGDLEHFASKA